VACPDALRMLLHFVASVPGTGLAIGVDAGAASASAPSASTQIEMLGQLLAAQPAAAARVEAVIVGSEAEGGVIAEATLIRTMRQVRRAGGRGLGWVWGLGFYQLRAGGVFAVAARFCQALLRVVAGGFMRRAPARWGLWLRPAAGPAMHARALAPRAHPAAPAG
jgi:hypothetical protein